MKKTTIVHYYVLVSILGTFLMYNAKGQSVVNKTFSINLDKVKIEKALKEISTKTNVKFNYSSGTENFNAIISYNATNKRIIDFINEVLIPNGINYQEVKGSIVLFITKKNASNTIKQPDNPKLRVITGYVKDSVGLPLEGVTVKLKGTNISQITDKYGHYSINATNSDQVLVFSYVGCIDVEKKINTDNFIDIRMAQLANKLDEVIVIGYGTVKKSDLTGSVVKLKTDDIGNTPISSFDQFIQGRAAGVQVTQNTGAPGAGATFLIRGASSVSGSNQPLIVIDGYPVETGEQVLGPRTSTDNWSNSVPAANPLAAINPNDIESIEILKDASSTAIYGTRGANGVVMITTKKGKAKKDQVSFAVRGDYSVLPKKIDVLRTPDYIDYVNEARANSGLTPAYTASRKDSLSKVANFFWQDLIYQPALSVDNQLSISGGGDRTKYALSANYRKMQGIVKNSEFVTGSVRLSLEKQMTKSFKLSGQFTANLNVNNAAQQANSQGEPSGSIITGALNFSPITDPYAANDFDPNLSASGNPLTLITKAKNQSKSQVFLLNVKAEYKIIDGLTYLCNAGVNSTNSARNVFLPRGTFQGNQSNGLAVRSESENYNYLIENTFNYNKVIQKKHSVNAVLGYTYQQFTSTNLGFQVSNFTTEALEFYNLALGGSSTIPASAYQRSGLASYLGRVNYSYNNKYLFTITGRADGSSRLATGKKWDFFPAVAAGWNIHNEQFFHKNYWVNELKLRASLGQTGNQSIPVGSSLYRVGPTRTIVNGTTITTALSPSALGNDNLTWEKTDNINIGLDASFLNKRITFTADVYRRLTKGLLILLALPGSTGYNNYASNAGSVENKGLELSMNAKVLNKKLSWNIASNISFNRNKVIGLGNNAQIFGTNTYWIVGSVGFGQPISVAMAGHPIGSFFGYKTDGIYQNSTQVTQAPYDPANPQPGDIRYKDIDGDGEITLEDRTVIGNPFPKYNFGITNDFSYKGITLSFFIMGNIGQDVANMNRFPLDAMNTTTGYNIRKEAWDNRWRGEGTSNFYPAPQANGTVFSNRFSDFFIEDGSFVRLKNVILSYQVPLKKTAIIKNAKVFVTATNLLTISRYKGYDPEVSAQGNSALNAGVDIGVIPQYKTYSTGINLTF